MNLGAGTGQWPSIGRWLKRAAIFCLNEKEIVKDHEFRPEMLGFTRLNLVEKKKTCVHFPQQKRWNQCTIATEIRRKETKMTFRERKMLSVTNGKFPPFCCEKTLRNLWDDETKFVEKNVQAQACQMHLIGSVVVMATAFSQNWGFTCAFDSWSHWPGIKWRMIRVTMATNSEISACRTSLGRYGYRPLTCSSQIIGRLLSSSASILDRRLFDLLKREFRSIPSLVWNISNSWLPKWQISSEKFVG